MVFSTILKFLRGLAGRLTLQNNIDNNYSNSDNNSNNVNSINEYNIGDSDI